MFKSKTLKGWPASSAAAYCKRLAVIARPMLNLLTPEERALLPGPCALADYGLQPDPLEPPNDPALLDEALALSLYCAPQLQSRLAVITKYTTSKWLLEQELQARGKWPRHDLTKELLYGPEDDAYLIAASTHTTGLALSGGGIRSATFALGVLQGLARNHLIGKFDYLSSVSGGGYIHQFLAAWIKRNGSLDAVQKMMDVLPNIKTPDDTGKPSLAYATVQAEPIRWLRRYSNYLAPQKSLFSGDTWTLFAIISRNAALNLLTLISCLLAVLVFPHLAISPRIFNWIRIHHEMLTMQTSFSAGLLALPCMVLALLIGIACVTRAFWPTIHFARGTDEKPKSSGATFILVGGLLPIVLATVIATPSAYRSVVPTQAYIASDTPVVFSEHRGMVRSITTHVQSIDDTYKHDTTTHPPVSALERLQRHWDTGTRPRFPLFPLRTAPSKPSFIPLRSLDTLFVLLASFGLAVAICVTLPIVRLDRSWKHSWKLILLAPLLFVVVPALALLLLHTLHLFMFSVLFFVEPTHILRVCAVFIPLLLLGIPCVVLEITMGLIGSEMEDAQREWLSRFRAYTFLWGMLWLSFGGISLLGPPLVSWIASLVFAKYTLIATWLGTSLGGVIAGQSPRTNGKNLDQDTPGISALEILTIVAPPVFVIGLLLLLSSLAQAIISAADGNVPYPLTVTMLASLVIALLFGWRVDINDFSMQPFYRDRLARCYAAASDPDRVPDKFTGFSGEDRRIRVSDLLPSAFGFSSRTLWKKQKATPLTPRPDQKKPDQKKNTMSVTPNTQTNEEDLRVTPTYQGPFPIFCTSINLTQGQDLAFQERKAASFAFTPLYSGYSTGWTESKEVAQQYNGYVPTVDYAYGPDGIAMATAVATSGAAASPNSGYHTNPAVAFLLTMFNVRLGWWIRNPRTHKKGTWSSPVFGLLQLLNELRGSANDASRYVYLSDGGHFENMGVYELVRRRCRTIVICDGEQDVKLQFDGLAHAVRMARLDFGVDIDLQEIRGMKNDHTNPGHAVVGTITYPEAPSNPGTILYLKTSLDGDEPADIVSYKRQDPGFPQDSTLNQFFTESKFESYRALGVHIATRPSILAAIQKALADPRPAKTPLNPVP